MASSRVPVRAELLGTGTSTGIPVIGCDCRVCTSTDKRDRRLRCACHIVANGVHLQIDTGPDFREQAIRAGIRRIDAVILTHHHFDHVAGLDDLRPFLFENREPIPCYALPETAAVLGRMHEYIFADGTYPGVPDLELREMGETVRVSSRFDRDRVIDVQVMRLLHGSTPVAGIRVGDFAYLTDTNGIPPEEESRLKGLEVLVLDALRDAPHPTHFSIPEAVEVARRIAAIRTAFIHMTHSVLHAETDDRLPGGMTLGYDGQVFETGAGRG